MSVVFVYVYVYIKHKHKPNLKPGSVVWVLFAVLRCAVCCVLGCACSVFYLYRGLLLLLLLLIGLIVVPFPFIVLSLSAVFIVFLLSCPLSHYFFKFFLIFIGQGQNLAGHFLSLQAWLLLPIFHQPPPTWDLHTIHIRIKKKKKMNKRRRRRRRRTTVQNFGYEHTLTSRCKGLLWRLRGAKQ